MAGGGGVGDRLGSHVEMHSNFVLFFCFVLFFACVVVFVRFEGGGVR